MSQLFGTFKLPVAVTLPGLIVLLLAAGCSHKSETAAAPPVPVAVPTATTDKSTGQVTIYKRASNSPAPDSDPLGGLVAETVQIPVDAMSPARDAIQYLITVKDSPIPKGTRLLGVSVDNSKSTATINLSKQFGNVKGETEAQMAVNSMLATMGQFGNVDQVQFQIDGKSDGDLGGVVTLADPMPVIRPEARVAQKEDKQ